MPRFTFKSSLSYNQKPLTRPVPLTRGAGIKPLVMKKLSLNQLIICLRVCVIAFVLAVLSLFLFSFTVHKFGDDFLKQLGITKSAADEKITGSILGGYLDAYGVKNAKNIATGNRAAIAKDLLTYTKQYVKGVAFVKQYSALKESRKPQLNKTQAPEEMQRETIASYKKSVTDMEATVKTADASMKPIFEKVLIDAGKQLKEAEDPNNKSFVSYKKNYPELVNSNKQNYEKQLADWENEYPSNHLLFVKKRLQQFLDETKDIDFAAELTVKNGKKIFVNRAYESKGNRWKMAFRAGKEVVEPARAFVQQWMEEIK